MNVSLRRLLAVGIFAAAAAAGCKSTTPAPTLPASKPASVPPALGPNGYVPPAGQPFNPPRAISKADVDFMSGMIPHHAQAVIMAGWAPTHGARADVKILCERIVVAQRDEIGLMQQWLRDNKQPVPDATSTKMRMVMGGMAHDMLMPGMLTDEEMTALDKARGAEFDRLFLIGMIKHHQGAIDMVDVLMKSDGAAQDDGVYKFASDVFADQTAEIARMQQMLAGGQF